VLSVESPLDGSSPSLTAIPWKYEIFFVYLFYKINNMAEFSKQWCEIHDPEMSWDFDIEEIATQRPRGYYKPIICEGFGFVGIGVGMNRDIQLLFADKIGDKFDKVNYNHFIRKQKESSDGI
jgi:hypothetical protein